MNNTDHKIVKASFKSCPISDRKLFSVSKCILPISIGQTIHEDKKLIATLKLINSAFKSCTILVDDSIQRYTMKITSLQDITFLHQFAISEGDRWLERNNHIIKFLSIPYDIQRWDDWIQNPLFHQSYQKVTSLYNQDNTYKSEIDQNIHEFLSRNFNHSNPSFNFETAFNLCRDYLLEECAVMCLWVQGNYAFEVYPHGRNRAMVATYDWLIKPTYPHLLHSVSLRFKKYPAKAESPI